MNVNRSRFLLLTAALAAGAGGCTINNTTVNGDGGASQDASVSDSTTGDGGGGDAGTDSAGDDGGDGGEGGTCDDTVGTVPDCAMLADAGVGDGGTSCAQGTAFPAACGAWAANLKNKVAASAINCAVALPSCESGAGLATCLSGAINAACNDSTAATTCNAITAICADAGADAGPTLVDCQQALSGLNQMGRDAIQTCFREGACAMDLAGCIQAKILP